MKRSIWATDVMRPDGILVALLYLLFGFGDLVLSLAAFRVGVAEANPVLALLAVHGLFVPAKLLLTLLAATLIGIVYQNPRARLLCWSGVVLMALVDIYHVLGLTARLPV